MKLFKSILVFSMLLAGGAAVANPMTTVLNDSDGEWVNAVAKCDFTKEVRAQLEASGVNLTKKGKYKLKPAIKIGANSLVSIEFLSDFNNGVARAVELNFAKDARKFVAKVGKAVGAKGLALPPEPTAKSNVFFSYLDEEDSSATNWKQLSCFN